MKVNEVRQFIAEHPNAIVKFYRPGCPYCDYVKPLYQASKSKYSDKVAFLAVDISADPDLKREFGFATVPEFQYYKDGAKKRNHGSNNRQLTQADIDGIIEEIYS
jgi:thiol-disulfide isomerase/thioredoxin